MVVNASHNTGVLRAASVRETLSDETVETCVKALKESETERPAYGVTRALPLGRRSTLSHTIGRDVNYGDRV